MRNSSTVCCPVLVLGAALLFTLWVRNLRREFRKRNRCLDLQSTSIPYRRGIRMFLAGERPDIQFCVKECSRGVGNSSARDMQRAKRICRYLMGTRDWTLTLERWGDVDTLQMLVDSNWATDKVDRRSTSASVAQLGGCTILSYSRTGSPALLSAEAEGYALGSGACDGLFVCAVASDLGVELKLALHSDSTATVSQQSKMGLCRIKHVELRFLFVTDLLKREKLTLCKFPGTEIPADLGANVR